MVRRKIVIAGAAGRDFHNFNTCYRNNEDVEVVAFTATQIPDIAGRRYPRELAGDLYPDGIPIYEENQLETLIRTKSVEEVIFSYSDVSYVYVMQLAARVNAAGAKFSLLGATPTMLKSTKPVIAVCAVRTGCGKSQTTRAVADELQSLGLKVVTIRHPMPYGELVAQRVQRFGELADLDKHQCTIEEWEEYKPHIEAGVIVYAGVDYEAILREAEKEADVILWDGGNNDMSFYRPDLTITVVDPHRPGHELTYFPGMVNLLLADVIVMNKLDSACPDNVATVRANIAEHNPNAIVIDAASPISGEGLDNIHGKRVLVIEDGPTCTHGGMKIGAGVIAARKFGAAEIVDPRSFLQGSLVGTFEQYPDIGSVLPAMGYGDDQVADLEATLLVAANSGNIDLIISATPIDLSRVLTMPDGVDSIHVSYDLQEIGSPTLADQLEAFYLEHFAGHAESTGSTPEVAHV